MQAEAQLAAGLYQELTTFLRGLKPPPAGPTTVGVITFYRQQVEHVRQVVAHIDPQAPQQVRPHAPRSCVGLHPGGQGMAGRGGQVWEHAVYGKVCEVPVMAACAGMCNGLAIADDLACV